MNRYALLTTLALTGTAFAGTELIVDGSFEDIRSPLKGGGFRQWDNFTTNAIPGPESGDSVTPLDGSSVLKTFGGFFGPGIQSDSLVSQFIDVPDAGGKSFRATVSCLSPSDDLITPLDFDDADGNGSFGHLPLLLMAFKDSDGNTLSQPEVRTFDPTADAADTWVESSVEGVAPAGTVQIEILCLLIQFGDDPGALFWDQVSLEEVEGTGPDCPGGQDDPDRFVEDSSVARNGFMNVSELPANGGGFVFGSPWAVEDLTATFNDAVPSVTMTPAQIDDPDPFWYIGGGAPGAQGNKNMEANLFEETTGCLAGQTVTFSGFVHENSFVEGVDYIAEIWIKDFASDYSSFNETRIAAVEGPFTVSHDTIDDVTRHVQWGFSLTGPNVWPGDQIGLGSVTFSSVPSMLGCNAADLAEPFGTLDLSDISAFVAGFTGQTPDGDINGDGIYDLDDISAFITAFTGGCP